MKVNVECSLCLFRRGYMEIVEATDNPELRLKAATHLLKMLAENLHPDAIPAVLETMRDRIIKYVTGNRDPFAEKKRISNLEVIRVHPLAEKIICREESEEKRFRKACLCAVAGNAIEFNIPEYIFDFRDLERFILETEQNLAIDDTNKAFTIAKKSSLIVYLADNAGEIALDTLFVRELKRLGSEVIVAVKGGPVYNDATIEDAISVGMDKIADKVITTGADMMGIIPQECSQEFLKIYNSADIIIAKGVANSETITEMELKVPHLLLLRTKCMNAARYFGVEKDKNVIRLLHQK